MTDPSTKAQHAAYPGPAGGPAATGGSGGAADADNQHGFALRDLDLALQIGWARHGHLLTAGERVVLRTLQAARPQARALYARLFARQDRLLRADSLHYAEVEHVPEAIVELVQAGLATDLTGPVLPLAVLGLHDLPALKAHCRSLGIPTSGRRAVVEARLLARSGAVAPLRVPCVQLRHRRLVRRMCRAWLIDHSGDLGKLVLARMDILRPTPHPVTGGPGLHAHRRGMLAYEHARRRWTHDLDDPEAELDAALHAIATSAAPDPARRRFTPLPFAVAVVQAAARVQERRGDAILALASLERLSEALAAIDEPMPAETVRRMALCADRCGRPEDGVAWCSAAMETADPVSARALETTGRRLARRARAPWRPLPALRRPDRRTLALPPRPGPGHRPLWGLPDGDAAPVELAVAAHLQAAGRAVHITENAPWTTIFGLLLWDAIFAPVPGMLPGPAMHRPLDLGQPGFAERRAAVLNPLLARITAGAGPTLLREALQTHDQEAIVGVRWTHPGPDTLEALVAAVPGPALAGILRTLAANWRALRSGFPDLCMLPGPAFRLDQGFPGRVSDSLLFIEVKAPNDTLRDGQRFWLDHLVHLGLRAEVWDVTPTPDEHRTAQSAG